MPNDPADPRDRLAAIVDSSDDAIVAKDLNGIIQSWNRGAERIFGFTSAEAVGKHVGIIIPDELLEEEAFILGKVRAGERVEHFETVRRRKDGRRINIGLTVSPVKDRDGNVVGASKIARDITEMVAAREAIRDMNRILEERVAERTSELQEAITDLESFSSAVSHDLRTPLRAISGLVELITKDTNLTDAQRRKLDLVQASAHEMTRITEALLRLSRIQRGSIRREEVSVTPIVEYIFERLRTEHPTRPAELWVEQGLSTNADPSMALIVLENLIANAWKFSQRKEILEIKVGRADHLGRKRFYVRDNGIGFTAQEAETLFRPFLRLRPKEFDGLGIGLATVQRVLLAHGGSIFLEGVPDHGATVWFDFGNPR